MSQNDEVVRVANEHVAVAVAKIKINTFSACTQYGDKMLIVKVEHLGFATWSRQAVGPGTEKCSTFSHSLFHIQEFQVHVVT